MPTAAFLLSACGASTTVTVVRTMTVKEAQTVTVTQTSAASTSVASTAESILPPATVPPQAPECSAQLQIGADGNAGPLTCPNGALNALAWAYFAKDDPLVMTLGPNATPDQVLQAMCSDLHTNSTGVIELSAYRLAALYYGWQFGISPTQEFPGACSTPP